MMMRRMCGAMLAGAALALCGCVTCGGESAAALTVTQGDKGKKMVLEVGQTMTVRLPGNYTTGYCWRFLVPRDGLELVSEDYELGNARLAGAPGMAVITVRATKAGVYPLVGYYYRPWESLEPHKDTCFHVMVSVAAKK